MALWAGRGGGQGRGRVCAEFCVCVCVNNLHPSGLDPEGGCPEQRVIG